MATGEQETLNLTPTFHYHRDIEIVKRFFERLTVLSSPEGHLGSEALGYIRRNMIHVRPAVSGLMADDIERQIKISEDFPIGFPTITFHEFAPYDPNPRVCTECDGLADNIVHTL